MDLSAGLPQGSALGFARYVLLCYITSKGVAVMQRPTISPSRLRGGKGAGVGKYRLGVVLAIGLLVMSLAGASPAYSQVVDDDVVEDVLDVVLRCGASADHPSPSNAEITSHGEFGCNKEVVMEITVCLELAQVPVSCTSKGPRVTSGLQATTDPIPCIPGIYQTRTVGRVIAPVPMTHTIHSVPPVLIVQCV